MNNRGTAYCSQNLRQLLMQPETLKKDYSVQRLCGELLPFLLDTLTSSGAMTQFDVNFQKLPANAKSSVSFAMEARSFLAAYFRLPAV